MRHSFLVAALFVLGTAAIATTVIPRTVEQLTASSTHVVRARAVDHHSEWNADHTRIFTYTRFLVLQSFKGDAPSTITVKQLGGHAGGYNMKVAGVRYWQNGEQAVLFLQSDADATFAVTGLMQGDFRLDDNGSGEIVVSNGVPEANELEATGEVRAYRGSRMTLRQLQERVIKAAQQ